MLSKRSVRGGDTPRTLQEHLDELKKTGRTVVPCPHGMGKYQIKLSGSKWYATPEIVFSASEKCPYPYNDANYAGSSFRVSEGRVIAWYPKWKGRAMSPRFENIQGKMKKNEHMLRLAKMAIMIIMSGRRLYSLRCGDSMGVDLMSNSEAEAERRSRTSSKGRSSSTMG